jgi:hypothetical protein
VEHLLNVVHAYAKWPKDISQDFVHSITALMCEDNGRLIKEELMPGQLVAMLRAVALWGAKAKAARRPGIKLRWSCASVFRLAVEPLMGGVHTLQPTETAAAFWAFSKMAVAPPHLLGALYEDLVKAAPQLPEPALASSFLPRRDLHRRGKVDWQLI